MKRWQTRLREIRHRLVAISILLIALSSHLVSSAHGQQNSKEDRQRTIDWFINQYYYPKALCAFAAPADRARLEELQAIIRKENLRAFELAEASKEYADTVAILKPKIAARFRDKATEGQATAECAHLTEQLAAARKRRRHDALFEMLVKLFAGPT